MNRLFVEEILSVGMVAAGDNPESEVLIYKSHVDKREVSTEEREKLAGKGQAMPDGSFPIANTSDLKNAVQAFGRAKNKPAVKKHIIRRAKALGKTDALPEGWVKSKMTSTNKSAESTPLTEKVTMDLSAIEDQDLVKSIEDKFEELESQVSELTAKIEEATPDPDPVEKADPAVQALLKAQDDKIAGLEADVTKERAERRTAEYVVKAKPLAGLIGKADEMGPVLADLAEKAPDSFDKLFSSLEAAAQRTDLAKLFAELGTGEGEGEGDPIAKRDAWVEKNQKDDESKASAMSRFWSENPDMVEESRNQ